MHCGNAPSPDARALLYSQGYLVLAAVLLAVEMRSGACGVNPVHTRRAHIRVWPLFETVNLTCFYLNIFRRHISDYKTMYKNI